MEQNPKISPTATEVWFSASEASEHPNAMHPDLVAALSVIGGSLELHLRDSII